MKTVRRAVSDDSNRSLDDSLIRSRYAHDPQVLAQLAECLEFPISKLIDRITGDRDNDSKVKEETLVMLAREYSRRGKDALAWRIILTLCGRVQPSIVRAARLWRLSPVAAEEVVESLVSMLYDVVLTGDGTELFWEIKFWVCFERRLLTSLKRHRTSEDRKIEADFSDPLTEKQATFAKQISVEWKDPALRVIVAEGLSQLPDNLRTAFMLKHWAGFAEHSVDPAERATIAATMGVSSRTVRNYLYRAEKLLNEWRRDGTLSLSMGEKGNE